MRMRKDEEALLLAQPAQVRTIRMALECFHGNLDLNEIQTH